MAKQIRNQVRVIPEIAFFNDDSLEYASKIDDILANLDIPEEKDEEESEED